MAGPLFLEINKEYCGQPCFQGGLWGAHQCNLRGMFAFFGISCLHISGAITVSKGCLSSTCASLSSNVLPSTRPFCGPRYWRHRDGWRGAPATIQTASMPRSSTRSQAHRTCSPRAFLWFPRKTLAPQANRISVDRDKEMSIASCARSISSLPIWMLRR